MQEETLPPLIITRPGYYRHYKNLLYQVLGTVRHSESLEPMTLYKALYGEQGLWVRPAAMFNETVDIKGVIQPFYLVGRGTARDLKNAATAAGKIRCSCVSTLAASVSAVSPSRTGTTAWAKICP